MDIKFYYKLVLWGLILNLSWAFLSTQIEYIISPNRENPEGFLTGLGFVIVYSLTFFTFILKPNRTLSAFIVLTATLGAVFLVATFVVGMIFINSGLKYNDYILAFFSSFVAALSIVAILTRYFFINRKIFTIALTTIIAFSTLIIFRTYFNPNELDDTSFKRVIHPIAIGYCLWQLLTTITIGQSITNDKPAHNKSIANSGAGR